MAPKSENPMPLENLPGYLQSAQENGNIGSPVVNMGQIVVPQKSYTWSIVLALFVCVVLSVGSLMTYNAMSTQTITVVVDINQTVDPQNIPQMVADSGGEVVAVKQQDNDTFEVELKTRKSKHSFLEWLLKDRNIKKAELKE